MNKFWTILVAAALAMSLSAISFAQDAGPKGGLRQGNKQGAPGKGGGMQRMIELQKEILAQLNLTDAQKKAIAELDKKTAADLRKAFEAAGGDREKLRGTAQRIHKDHRESLNKILTKEQQVKYRDLYMAKMKELREKRNKGQEQA